MKLATNYDLSKLRTAFAASGESFSSISEATGIAVSTVSRLLQSGNGYSRNLLAVAKALKLSASDIVLLGTATQQAASIPTPRPFMSAGAQTKMGGKRAKQLARLADDILSKPKPAPGAKPARKQKTNAKRAKTTPAARKTAAIPRPTATKAKARPKTKEGRSRAAKAGGKAKAKKH